MSFFPPMGPLAGPSIGDPDGWDRCEIGFDALPGLARVVSASLMIKVDRKSKPGANAKKPTFLGIDEQPVVVELKMITDDDRDKFAVICQKIQPGAKGDPPPLHFDHPSVRHLGIKTVVVTKISELVYVSPNVTTCKIEMLDWRPSSKNQKDATSTPTQARKKGNAVANAPEAKNPTPVQQGAPAGGYVQTVLAG